MTVELLHFDGCPHYQALLSRLREILRQKGIDTDVVLRRVETEDEANSLGFLGSPTVRVDGSDIEPTAAGRDDFGLKCRLYRTDSGLVGTPPDALVMQALARAGVRRW